MRLDEDARVAYMDWELKLEEQTCIYGDNDRLPTGNLLASSWPVVIDAAAALIHARYSRSCARRSRRRERRS